MQANDPTEGIRMQCINVDAPVPERARRPRLIGSVIVMIGGLAIVSFYNFWRIDRVAENMGLANQFYVPALKQLNLLNGKWSAYQRSYEQYVAFRQWGTATRRDRPVSRLPLKKLVESHLAELSRLLEREAAPFLLPERFEFQAWIQRLKALADGETAALLDLESLLKAKRFADAAALYTRNRQEHYAISQGLSWLNQEVEARLSSLQLATERELRESQSFMLFLLAASLVVSLVVLFRLRRWLLPIVEWTNVAREIALKGIHRDVRFPRIHPAMPAEISLLTREFTRMGMTLLERERTIHQQKDKLEALNIHLKEQNGILKKLGALNERTLNSMTAGLLVIGPDGLVEQFNDRYCALFRVERSGILGFQAKNALVLWPSELVEEWLSADEPIERARVPLGNRVFDVRVSQLFAQGGRLLLFDEVTGLTRAEEKLEHAKKLMLAGSWSAQIAHEVRNPLNSMSLQLEMLDEDLGEFKEADLAEKARARLVAVDEQIRRLERITKRYLDVRSRGVSRSQNFDLHALIEKSVVLLSAEIQSAKIEVILKLEAKDALIRGDADALVEVLFNLIRNAIEAMRSATERKFLWIASRDENGQVQLRLSDSGPGVSEEIRSRLFEPFATDKADGHGLGLSVSRQICIAHGGELSLVESGRGKGEQGAVFELTLPLAAIAKTEERTDARLDRGR